MTKATERKPRRRELIPAIREKIVDGCPGAAQATVDAIDNWRDGNDPQTPYENGVFAVCDQIAADIDKMEAPKPSGS